MNFFAVNLLLAFVWAALMGVSIGNLLLGFALGFGALVLTQPFVGSDRYVHRTGGVVHLALVFIGQLLAANARLARDVLRRRPRFAQAFLRLEVPELSRQQTAVLAAMISLTPGSITVDVVDEGRTLVVHTVYGHDPEAARGSLQRLAGLVAAAGPRPAPTKESSP